MRTQCSDIGGRGRVLAFGMLALLAFALLGSPNAVAQSADFSVPGGWFFT